MRPGLSCCRCCSVRRRRHGCHWRCGVSDAAAGQPGTSVAVKHTCACPPSLPAGLPCSYYASADGGATWSSNALPVPTTPASPTAMAAVYGAALLSSTGPQLLIAGSGGHVMQTNDGGATWTDVSPVDGDGCDMLTANTIRGLQAVGNSV